MKKFIIEIVFFFFLPLSIIAVVAEYSLRNIPNDYAYKSNWLNNNSSSVEVLYLGPSTIFYDIDPTLSKLKGFNAAHVSQPIEYDHFIFNKYIDQMPALKYVVMGIDYWSPHGTMKGTTEWWRIKYYTIHYDNPDHERKGKYKYELYFHNTETLGIAAKGALRLVGLNNISHRTVNELGFGTNYSTAHKPEEWDNGVSEGERHNLLAKNLTDGEILYKRNMELVKDICNKAKERGIKIIILGSPHYKSYNNTINQSMIKERAKFCQAIADQYDNTTFINLSETDLFTEEDYYDALHLNDVGAKKLTEILDSIMIYDL